MKSIRTVSALTGDGSFLITVLAQGCCVWLDLTLFHVLNTQQTVNEAILSAPHPGSLGSVGAFQARKGPARTHPGRVPGQMYVAVCEQLAAERRKSVCWAASSADTLRVPTNCSSLEHAVCVQLINCT